MNRITNVSPLLFAMVLCGCPADDNNGKETDDTGGGTVEVPSFTFLTEVNAQGIDGDVGADALDQHRVANTVFSAVQLALAEPQVQSRLQVDNGGGRSNHCWTAPPVAQTNFIIDYTPCANDGITGGIYIDDTPQGPVIIEFLNFTFDESREISGAVALDSATADSSMEWLMYDADPNAPSPDTRAPISVEIDGNGFLFGTSGGGALDLQFNSWNQWGAVTVSSVGAEATVLAGGTVAEDLFTTNKPSDALSGPLAWTNCRCPYFGKQTYAFDLDITEISVDLDKVDSEDDDEDDPEMSFFKEANVTGSALLTTTACGEYEVEFTPTEEPTVIVTGPELRAEIGRLCDVALIEEVKCIGFLAAADEVDTLTVTITENKMQAAAETTVRNNFDTSFCKIQ